MNIKIIVIFLFIISVLGCAETNENNLRVHLNQETNRSTNKKLYFTISVTSSSEAGIPLSVHEDIKDTLILHSGKWLNKCKKPSFYLNGRNSDVIEVSVSKSSPYILNISADYWFDKYNNWYVIDFGELGKICRDKQNTKIDLYVKFYKANISTFEGLMYDKSDGIISNKIEIKLIDRGQASRLGAGSQVVEIKQLNIFDFE